MSWERGNRKRTPILDMERERRASGSGPVITYTMSPEEIEARYGPPGSPAPKQQKEEKPMGYVVKDGTPIAKKGPDKVKFLEGIVAGKSKNKAGMAAGIPSGGAHYWMDKWGLKGISPERAQQMLDEMAIDGEAKSEPAKSEEAGEKPGKDEAVVAVELDEIPEAEQPAEIQPDERDVEIQRLRNELADALSERQRLKKQLEQLEQELIEQPAAIIEAMPVVKVERQIRIEATGHQNVIEDELLAILNYVQAMNGKQLRLELCIGEARTENPELLEEIGK